MATNNDSLRKVCDLLASRGLTSSEIIDVIFNLSDSSIESKVVDTCEEGVKPTQRKLAEEKMVISILEDYGVKKSLRGYQYLKYVLMNVNVFEVKAMEIYQKVADVFQLQNFSNAERCIRTAVASTGMNIKTADFLADAYEKVLIWRKANIE